MSVDRGSWRKRMKYKEEIILKSLKAERERRSKKENFQLQLGVDLTYLDEIKGLKSAYFSLKVGRVGSLGGDQKSSINID